MVFDGARPDVPTVAAFDGTTQARIGQLLGDEISRRRVPPGLAMVSAIGAVVATSLFMCLGQELWMRLT
jgi:hypothetical protein